MSTISAAAAAARESVRGADGRFGEQDHADPGQLALDAEDPEGPAWEARSTRRWEVSVGGFEAMRARVEAINARAAKKGWTGRLELAGEQRTLTETIDGLRIERTVVDARLTGEPPRYAGWTFLATLEEVQTGPETTEFIVHTQPGAESGVDRSGLQPGVCDHCGSRRHRRRLYLVRDEAGATRQVGSTCIKDFLGWSVVPPLVDDGDVADELDRFGGYAGGEVDHPTDFTVAVALAAVEEYGWHPSADLHPTGEVVAAALSPRARDASQVRRALAGRMEAARAQAPTVIAEVLAGLDTSTDYGANLAAALHAPATTARRRALVVSTVAAWKRMRADQARQQANAASEWVGQPGDKLSRTVTVERADTVDGYAYNSTQRFLLLRDSDGNLFKTYSAARWTYEVSQGETIQLEATVKKHSEYRGTKQTEVTRVKRRKA